MLQLLSAVIFTDYLRWKSDTFVQWLLLGEYNPNVLRNLNKDYHRKKYGLNIETEVGIEKVVEQYRGNCCVHLDTFSWVRRDSYLPQGAQGLKAVTKYKLGYDPVEIDPEDMT